MLGFIGYSEQQPSSGNKIVRIYLECRESSAASGGPEGFQPISCGDVVDVVYPGGNAPCQLRGVDGVLVLKKFYKLVFSLEERAREHGNDWRAVMASAEGLLEHLRYTRNARDFTGQAGPRPVSRAEEAEPECTGVSEGA